MPLEDIEEGTDVSENEEENLDTSKTKPFLYYLSEYMDNDTGCETSENEGISDNDDEPRAQSTELTKDDSDRDSDAGADEEKETNSRRNTVVGG